MDTVERDVEQVARAMVDATGVQWPDRSLLGPWLKSARAAMAARDEQLRARLVSDQALEVLASTMNNGPFGEPERAVGWLRALASFVFGPAPRVEPIDRAFTDGEEPAESIHRARRPAPLPMAAPVTDAEVDVAIVAWYGVEAAKVGKTHEPTRRSARDALAAFVAGRVASATDPPASDTLEAAVERARKVYALECTQLQADVRKAEAEVARLTAERDAACEGREEAFRARDQASLRLSAECVRLTAALAEANEVADGAEAGRNRTRAQWHESEVKWQATLADMKKALARAFDDRDGAYKRANDLRAERDAATREAESLRAEVATCRHISETAERMRDAATSSARFTLSLLQKAEARVKRLTEQNDNLAYNMSSEREAKEEAESSLDAHRAVLDAATKRAEEAEAARNEGQRAAAGREKQCRAAERERDVLRAALARVRPLVEMVRNHRGNLHVEWGTDGDEKIDEALAAIASQPDADAHAGEDEWPAFPEPQDGDPIDDHMRRVSDHVRDVLALVKARVGR